MTHEIDSNAASTLHVIDTIEDREPDFFVHLESKPSDPCYQRLRFTPNTPAADEFVRAHPDFFCVHNGATLRSRASKSFLAIRLAAIKEGLRDFGWL